MRNTPEFDPAKNKKLRPGNFPYRQRIQSPDRVTRARNPHRTTRGSIMGEVDYEYCEELVVAIPMAALTWYAPIETGDENARFAS